MKQLTHPLFLRDPGLARPGLGLLRPRLGPLEAAPVRQLLLEGGLAQALHLGGLGGKFEMKQVLKSKRSFLSWTSSQLEAISPGKVLDLILLTTLSSNIESAVHKVAPPANKEGDFGHFKV